MDSSNSALTSIVQLVILLIIYFIWYYITLPGSYLSYSRNKYNKPPLKASFKQYFGVYLIPMYILVIFIIYKLRNNPLLLPAMEKLIDDFLELIKILK